MKQEKSTSLLGFLVFTLFSLCLLLTVLNGAAAYRKTLENTEDAFDKRTKTQYLSTKLRQELGISLEDFGGCEALAFRENLDGECYVTYVYCHEGWLRELFCLEGAGLSPADGEPVLEAEEMTASMESGLLTMKIDGEILHYRIRQ